MSLNVALGKQRADKYHKALSVDRTRFEGQWAPASRKSLKLPRKNLGILIGGKPVL